MIYATQELPARFHSLSEQIVPTESWSSQRESQVSRVEAGFRSMRSSIWNDLPLPALQPRTSARHENIIDIYTESHDRLEHYRGEANDFLQAICVANVVSHRDNFLIQRALKNEVAKLFAPIAISELPVDRQVGAELGRDDVLVAYSTLELALAKSLEELLYSFAHSLATLHAGEAVGSIAWTSDSMCKFTYALLEIHPSATYRQESLVPGDSVDGIRTTETTDCVMAHWQIEHHLTRGKMKSRLGLPRHAPPRASQLWDSIPLWLADHAAVVQGDLFRKHAKEVARWEDSVVRHSYHEEIQKHSDPAITLFDQLVLTAWDQQELELDQPAITVHTNPNNQPQPVVDNATITSQKNALAIDKLAMSLGLLCVPAMLSLICSLWFPNAFVVPILAAMLAGIPWMLNLQALTPRIARDANSTFHVYGVCIGVLACCASVAIPHAVATQSPTTFLVSILAVSTAVACWMALRNMLDEISS